MDLDSLTIGQARQLAALFGGTTTVAPATLGADRIGTVVLVRSRGSGVWIGTLVARSSGAAGHSVQLTSARRIWSWTGAAECSQLAETGPEDGKIGVESEPIVHEVLEEHSASSVAIKAIKAIKEWSA